jgi:hypothetical protein
MTDKVENKEMANLDYLEKAFQRLLRDNSKEFDAHFEIVSARLDIANTKAYFNCHHIALDGNKRPRVKDLAELAAELVIDYAIPRNQLEEAYEYLREKNSNFKISKLIIKANKLFTYLENTGECGELLLYIFIQNCLKIPQLLCKMPLKTSGHVHYHGVDGIHATIDQKSEMLVLYWGESKLYQSLSSAISECLDSIKPFLIDEGGSDSKRKRDLELVTDNINLCDEKLENAILRYLDPDDALYNKLEYRGACLIGFDCEHYPKEANKITQGELKKLISSEVNNWKEKVGKSIIDKTPLNDFVLEIFMLPFPSVQDFRDAFLSELGLLKKNEQVTGKNNKIK